MQTVIQTVETKCNFCAAAIAAPNANGTIRLNGTLIDACPICAQKTLATLAPAFTLPPQPQPPLRAGNKIIQLATGQKVQIPADAPLPVGATLITPAPVAAPAATAPK